MGPMLLIAVLLYSYFAYNSVELAQRLLHEKGSTIVNNLAPASEFGLLTGNREILLNLLSPLLADGEVASAAIVDLDGRIIVAVGEQFVFNAQNRSAQQENGYCYAEKDKKVFCHLVLLTSIQVDDYDMDSSSAEPEAVGMVYVVLTTQENQEYQSIILLRSLVIALLLCIATYFLVIKAGRRISRPLEAIGRAVEDVKRGNLDVQLEIEGKDEIEHLKQGINTMIDSLRNAKQDMEAKVEDATKQLIEAMAELEKSNKDLRHQEQKAIHASEAKSQFLATMSHEIRTPLSGMIGMLELLKEHGLRDEQVEFVKNISIAAEALKGLIDDILDFSRIEAGKLQLNEQSTSPTALVEDVANLLAPSAQEKDLEFICDIDTVTPQEVLCDNLRLRQVLINLAGNAVKFTEHGFVRIRLRVLSSNNSEQQVRFEIEDSGVGIEKDKLGSLFDSFTQVDNSSARKYAGTGLGTTISKELITLMGGRIGVTSHYGKGSRFWFEIPWKVALPAKAYSPVHVLRDKHLLVVEGNTMARESIGNYLEFIGIRADYAKDCMEAESVLSLGKQSYDLILIAENSRGSHGLACTSMLNEITKGKTPYCHITFFSGYSDSGRFHCKLSKPVTLSSLQDKLERFFGNAEEEHEETDSACGREKCTSLRVLVAEDDRINALVIKTFLEEAGHVVTLVANGINALNELREQPLDMVIMDMRMPEMDGVHATKAWRKEENGKAHIPIIALTANATTEDRKLCLEAGMDDFLSKPVDKNELCRVLQGYSVAAE